MGAPAERIHIDILGPFTPSSSGNQYILMLVCQFTKWLEAYPLSDQTAETVAKAIIDNFISRFGCPLQIHTDQGRNFTSSLFQAVCDSLDITKTRTTPYRPCSIGQVERYNRTLLQVMRCHLKGRVLKWDEDLPILTAAIRSLPNRQTGMTPNLMMLGREVRQPVDLVFSLPSNTKENDEPTYVKDLKTRMRNVHSLARDYIGSSQIYQKKHFDYNTHYTSFEEGDVVYKLCKASKVGQSRKLQPAWQGPLLVVKVLSPVLYKVHGRKKTQVLHHDLLKICGDGEIPLWLRRLRNRQLGGKIADIEEQIPDDQTMGLDQLFEPPSQGVPTETHKQKYVTRSGRAVKQPCRFGDQFH